MELNALLHSRLSGEKTISSVLAKYTGKPAVFNTEFPPDQQEGWEGRQQYPRISYLFNKQVDMQRAASGMLRVAVYDVMNPMEVEKLEVAVRNSLQDILLKPEGEAPMCFAWARSDPYILEGNQILCKEIVFDLLEYPAQETTDPDPVQALNLYIKNLFPKSIVLGVDELSDYTQAADTPVFYCGLTSIDSVSGYCENTISWFDAGISVHLICPDAQTRLKMIVALQQSLGKDEEVTMLDKSPMTIRAVKMSNKADYLREGQLSLVGHYGCLKDAYKGPLVTEIKIDER